MAKSKAVWVLKSLEISGILSSYSRVQELLNLCISIQQRAFETSKQYKSKISLCFNTLTENVNYG